LSGSVNYPEDYRLLSINNIRKKLLQIVKWQHFVICLLVIITLGVHFATIMRPNTYLFDEIYYVADAKSIITQENTLRPEHPSLGKLFIAAGIQIFGDNPLGWRFFSVIFGTVCIILIYLISRQLNMSRIATGITTLLFTFENLNFIQAGTAMLDVYSLTFMIAAILLYLRGNLISSGLCAGLSALTKLNGVLVLGIFFLFWLFAERRKWQDIVIPIFSTIISFFIIMPILDYAVSHQLLNPIQRLGYMLNVAGSLTSFGDYISAASYPWDWLMNRGILFYSYDPQYIAAISFSISLLIVPCVLYLIYKVFKKNRAALLALAWFACTYLPWIFASLVFHRIMYIYYFYPIVGALCIGIGLGLYDIFEKWKNNRQNKLLLFGVILIPAYLAIHLAIFLILSPLMPAIVTWLNI
jgi:dolichyl-phosphate-mannose-protein mannosyltransferase